MGGVFGSTINGAENPTLARDDVSVGLVWELQNLGLGNRAWFASAARSTSNK